METPRPLNVAGSRLVDRWCSVTALLKFPNRRLSFRSHVSVDVSRVEALLLQGPLRRSHVEALFMLLVAAMFELDAALPVPLLLGL